MSSDPTYPEAPGPVEIRRSARRRRTVSAYRDGDKTVVLVPARLSRAAEAEWVRTMLARLAQREKRAAGRTAGGDAALASRALELSARHFDGRAVPESVRWVTNQRTRWGSCTPGTRAIRLSHRLRGMPAWVVDYVLVHELAHLIEADHSPAFWRLVGRYPLAERARGYLLGVAATHPELAAIPDEGVADDDPGAQAGLPAAGLVAGAPGGLVAGAPGGLVAGAPAGVPAAGLVAGAHGGLVAGAPGGLVPGAPGAAGAGVAGAPGGLVAGASGTAGAPSGARAGSPPRPASRGDQLELG